jgi:hypothetical protein
VGLAGIGDAFQSGALNFQTMTADEVKLATRYAINELNGFASWLSELAATRPDEVKTVLLECVRAEWNLVSPSRAKVLGDLEWHGASIIHLLQDDLLKLLQNSDPADYGVLYSTVALLTRVQAPAFDVLLNIAQNRIALYQTQDKSFVLWLGLILQLNTVEGVRILEAAVTTDPDVQSTIQRICAFLSSRSHERGLWYCDMYDPKMMCADVAFILQRYVMTPSASETNLFPD